MDRTAAAKAVLWGFLALTAGVISVGFNEKANPVSEGSIYLEKQGYTNIQGGDSSYFNTCGKNVMSRQYTTKDLW